MKIKLNKNEKLSTEQEAPHIASIELPCIYLSVRDKQQKFQTELKALLVKYKAELSLENFGRGWSDDEKIVVDFEWDSDLCDRTDNGSVPQWIIGRWENGS